jgi:hypothetical protein
MRPILLALGLLTALPAGFAGDPPRPTPEGIRKEPAYKGKPGYLLLAFGPEGKDRVWLVHDGNTLYVDRNGDGDLTAENKKVLARGDKDRNPAADGYSFDAGTLTVGGKMHQGLQLQLLPLQRYAGHPDVGKLPFVRDALKADPSAQVVVLTLDVESTRFKGAGVGGRITQLAGFCDLTGLLRFADRAASASVVHLDGPLQITFFMERPTRRAGREQDTVLVVGTPGHGPGTLAMLAYEGVIPRDVYPTLAVTYPPVKNGAAPFREKYELKQRC